MKLHINLFVWRESPVGQKNVGRFKYLIIRECKVISMLAYLQIFKQIVKLLLIYRF